MALGTVVDTSVLLDVFDEHAAWRDWSESQLAAAYRRGPVLINQLIYAEVSSNFGSVDELDHALSGRVERENLPWEAGILAGRMFVRYRKGGGARRLPLPDFYIAAHAAVTGRALLTRDRPRHIGMLPQLEVIAPEPDSDPGTGPGSG